MFFSDIRKHCNTWATVFLSAIFIPLSLSIPAVRFYFFYSREVIRNRLFYYKYFTCLLKRSYQYHIARNSCILIHLQRHSVNLESGDVKCFIGKVTHNETPYHKHSVIDSNIYIQFLQVLNLKHKKELRKKLKLNRLFRQKSIKAWIFHNEPAGFIYSRKYRA